MHKAALTSVVLILLALCGCAAGGPTAEPAAASGPSSTGDRYRAELLACLEEAGWDAEFDTDGAVTVPGGIPQAQFPEYEEAVVTCSAPMEAGLLQLSEFTSEQWSKLYGLERDTAECLRTLGVDVPPIPSEQAFIEQYKSVPPWTSYGFVGSVDPGTWSTLNEKCPQPEI